MLRALELASLGIRDVSPNPMVGCVIVKNDQIIGEGWHQRFGGPHAEVNAINSVKNLADLENAEVFVTLEPCAHYGKTPPCAELLIKYPIKKVWICNVDLNPLVHKKGIEKLTSNGIEVVTSILENEGLELNKRFFTNIHKKRPYIILKWAETTDGFIARKNYDSKWISNTYSRKLVHKWRAEEDAIMVGTNTARYDNPQLNVRDWTGKNPIRIIIDKNLILDTTLHLFNGSQSTIVVNSKITKVRNEVEYLKIDFGESFLPSLFEILFKKNISSILVEGGGYLLESIIKAGLWDELRVFRGIVIFESGISSPKFFGSLFKKENIEDDILSIFKNIDNR